MPGDVLAQGRSRRDGLFDQKMHSDAVAVVTSQDIGRCPENVKFTQAASLGKTAIYGRALASNDGGFTTFSLEYHRFIEPTADSSISA